MADLKWVLEIVDKATAPARNVAKSLKGVQSSMKGINLDKLTGAASRGMTKLGKVAKSVGSVFATQLAPMAMTGLAGIAVAAAGAGAAFAKFAIEDAIDGEKLDFQLKQVIKDTKAFDAATQDINSLASILGNDPDEIQKQLTKLVGKGHSVASAFKIIQGAADLGAMGHDTAALVSAFSDLDDKGKLGAKSIAAMGAAGLNTAKLRDILGVAVGSSGDAAEDIEAAIKSGSLDVAKLQAAALKTITETSGKELGGVAQDFAKNTLPGVLESLKSAPGRLLNALDASSALEPARKALGALVAALDPASATGKRFIGLLQKISTAIGDMLSKVSVDDVISAVEGFASFLEVTADLTGALFGGLGEGLMFILQPIKDLMVQLDMGGEKSTFWIDSLKTLGKVVGFALGAVIIGFGAIAAVVLGVVQLLAMFFAELWREIKLIPQAFDNIVAWVSGAFDRLFTYLGSVWEGFKSFGKSIADGIWEGLKGAWAGLISKFKGLIDLLPDTVKKTLGIASPAKRMVPYGEHAVGGVEKGVDNKAAAMQAAMRMAVTPPKMTLSSLAASGSSSGGAPRSMSIGDIIVQVGGSNASAREIGKSVRAEVNAYFAEMNTEGGA